MIDKMEHDLVKIIGVYEDGSTQEYERGALVSLKREEDSTCATLQLAKCRPRDLMQIRDLVNAACKEIIEDRVKKDLSSMLKEVIERLENEETEVDVDNDIDSDIPDSFAEFLAKVLK